MSKKFLALLLALVMIVTAVPVTFAEGEVVEPTNEAKIGEQEYPTLEEAITAASNGNTVVLLKDITRIKPVVVNKAITLDGSNGEGGRYSITNNTGVSDDQRVININFDSGENNENAVTLQNLAIYSSGERGVNIIENPAKVVLNNVEIDVNNYAINVTDSAVNGSYTSGKSHAVTVEATDCEFTGKNTVNLNNYRITGTFTECTVNSTDTSSAEEYSAYFLARDSKATVIGGSVNVAGNNHVATSLPPTATITFSGTTYDSEKVITKYFVAKDKEDADYTYGYETFAKYLERFEQRPTFTKIELRYDMTLAENVKLPSNVTVNCGAYKITLNSGVTFVAPEGLNVVPADGCKIKKGEVDGAYTYKAVEVSYEAMIGSTGYETFEEAVDAANQDGAGGTITLLKDVTVENTIVFDNITNTFVLDGTNPEGENFTITANHPDDGSKENFMQIMMQDNNKVSGSFTLKNVNLMGEETTKHINIYNHPSVTFDNVNVWGIGTWAAMCINTSNVNITGNSNIEIATGPGNVVDGIINIDISSGVTSNTTASLTVDETAFLNPPLVYSDGNNVTAEKTVTVSVPGYKEFSVTDSTKKYWAPVAQVFEGTFGGDDYTFVKYYASLAEAVAAVKNGQTIELLVDCTETVTVNRTVSFNFVFWGNDISGLTINKGAYVTESRTDITEENGDAVIGFTASYVYSEPTYEPDPEPIVPVTPVEPEEEPLVPEVDTDSTVTESTTTENEDGSTTKSEVLENGATVETTTKEDGSSTVTATQTETKDNEDGSKTTTTVTNTTTADASGAVVTENTKEEVVETEDTKTTTTTKVTESETKKEVTEVKEEVKVDAEGNETVTTTATTSTELSNGSTGTTTVENGVASAEVTVSEQAVTEAAEAGTAIELPMAAVNTTKVAEEAATVTVNVATETEETTEVTVEIPVAEVTTGTVAVLVNEDGTETVIAGTVPTENGVQITVPAGATVKIVDNSMDFADVDDDHEYADAVNFASARGIVEGDAGNFDMEGTATRAQVWTMLARISGVDTTNSDPWYAAGQEWAVENGVSDGLNLTGNITTEQLFTMLHRMEGKPAVDTDHADGSSHWATAAHDWAVEMGLVDADGEVIVNASRGQVVSILMKYMTK